MAEETVFVPANEIKNFQGFKIKDCAYIKEIDDFVFIPRRYAALCDSEATLNTSTNKDQEGHTYCHSCFLRPCIMSVKLVKKYLKSVAKTSLKTGPEGDWVVRDDIRHAFDTDILPEYFPDAYLKSDCFLLHFSCVEKKIRSWYPGEPDDHLIQQEMEMLEEQNRREEREKRKSIEAAAKKKAKKKKKRQKNDDTRQQKEASLEVPVSNAYKYDGAAAANGIDDDDSKCGIVYQDFLSENNQQPTLSGFKAMIDRGERPPFEWFERMMENEQPTLDQVQEVMQGQKITPELRMLMERAEAEEASGETFNEYGLICN